jgi:putative DNA-invertase from lambdoid prophage Rac
MNQLGVVMKKVAYFRVSTTDQSIESQRDALLKAIGLTEFNKEYLDKVSGATEAMKREGFKTMVEHCLSKGDTLYLYSIDRIGRDAIDIQTTIRDLLQAGINVHVVGLGELNGEVGAIVTGVLAHIAQLERTKINERTGAGRDLAKSTFRATGKTHNGKLSLGRPKKIDCGDVIKWRRTNKASIADTAKHFGISAASVKRCATLS